MVRNGFEFLIRKGLLARADVAHFSLMLYATARSPGAFRYTAKAVQNTISFNGNMCD